MMSHNFYGLWVWLSSCSMYLFQKWNLRIDTFCGYSVGPASAAKGVTEQFGERWAGWSCCSLGSCPSRPLPLRLWTPVSALFCRWLPNCRLLHLSLLLLGPPSPETGLGTPTWNIHKTKIKDPTSVFCFFENVRGNLMLRALTQYFRIWSGNFLALLYKPGEVDEGEHIRASSSLHIIKVVWEEFEEPSFYLTTVSYHTIGIINQILTKILFSFRVRQF